VAETGPTAREIMMYARWWNDIASNARKLAEVIKSERHGAGAGWIRTWTIW
jgi:hypothetical protein